MDSASQPDTSGPLETTTPASNTVASNAPDLSSAIGTTQIIYILYAAGLVVGITALVAIVMNYQSKDAVRGTWLESHYKWQIRTFWFNLLWMSVSLLTMIVGIGFLVFPVAYVWYIYRVVRGWMQMRQGKPMYAF